MNNVATATTTPGTLSGRPVRGRQYRPRRSPLESFMAEIGRYPLLTSEDEIALGRLIHCDDPVAALAARDRLWTSNLRYAVSLARRYQGRGLDLPDLIQAAILGLLRAVEKFDPDAGYRFTTYADNWIFQNMQRAINAGAGTIRIPVHAYGAMVRRGKGREVTEYQIVAADLAERAMGVDTLTPTSARGSGTDVRSDLSQSEWMIDRREAEPWEEVERADEVERVRGILAEMAAAVPDRKDKSADAWPRAERIRRESRAITLRFGMDGGEPMTLREAAKAMHVTGETVRLLVESGLQRIRAAMGDGESR